MSIRASCCINRILTKTPCGTLMGRRRGIIIQNDINSRYKYHALCFALRICKYFNPFAGSNLSTDPKRCAKRGNASIKFRKASESKKARLNGEAARFRTLSKPLAAWRSISSDCAAPATKEGELCSPSFVGCLSDLDANTVLSRFRCTRILQRAE